MQGVSALPDTSHGECHRLSSDEACASKMPHFAVNFPLAAMELVLQSSPCSLITRGSQHWGQTVTAPACVCFHRWLTLSGQPAAWCSPRWWWCTPRGTASRVSPSQALGVLDNDNASPPASLLGASGCTLQVCLILFLCMLSLISMTSAPSSPSL